MYRRRHDTEYTCEPGAPLFAVSYSRRVHTADYVELLAPDVIRAAHSNS